ncbi:MAG: HlyD family type I secretion periplasmic adaptor subunit [Magnetococcales bacterium]|nr:HlyD family type I secretion periplasmic adaptor subunit [Magnetococcales bacterium]
MFRNRFSRHLTEAQILEESGISWSVKLILTGTILFTFLLLWLSGVVTVNEAVKATGEFQPAHGVQHIIPPEGGIVTEILVTNGQHVAAGALLLRLGNAATDAEQRQAEANLFTLRARAIRQEAFLSRSEPDFSAIPEKFAGVVREQRALLATQNQARQDSLQVFEEQFKQKRSEIELATQNLRTMEKTVRVNGDLLALQENLGRKQLVSRMSQLEAERTHVESLGKATTLREQIRQSQGALEEVLAKQRAYEEELRKQAGQELGIIRNDISQAESLLDRLSDRTRNLEIRSPIRGTVQDSRVRMVGAVFSSRDLLMDIVPDASDLQLELQILNKDIGYVRVGQKVEIQVGSYDFNRFGGITGQLVSLSPFTRTDAEKNIVYQGIVKPDATHVGDPRDGRVILPGMKARGDIVSGSRSLFAYIVNPLTRPDRKGTNLQEFAAVWLSLKAYVVSLIP